MDGKLLKKFIDAGDPFEIKTAGGETYPVPHTDHIAYSPKGTHVFVWHEDGLFSILPLLTITAVTGNALDPHLV